MKCPIFLLAASMVIASCMKNSDPPRPVPNHQSENPAKDQEKDKGQEVTNPTLPKVEVVADTRPIAATVKTETFDCDALDFGLFWFGKGDVAQKASAGTRSTFYDPTKPTLIYTHGWQANNHLLRKRGTFNYSKADAINGPEVDEADAWIEAGWNVGIFYWNQMADDSLVNTIEDRIWLDTPITWKNCKGTEVSAGVPPGNISDMLFTAYVEAMKDYKGPNVRFAGHSLGSQLVTRVAANLAQAAKDNKIDAHLVPKRVALLDPFWAAGSPTQVSRAALVSALIAPLKEAGMIFEWYKTSALTDWDRADPNLALQQLIGRTETPPDWYVASNAIARHSAAIYIYFLSFASPPPAACKAPCTDLAPSAATADARMLDLMNKAARFKQVKGQKTPLASDNTFEQTK